MADDQKKIGAPLDAVRKFLNAPWRRLVRLPAAGRKRVRVSLTHITYRQRQEQRKASREKIRHALWDMSGSDDIDQMLQVLYQELRRLCPAIDACSVQVIDEEKRDGLSYRITERGTHEFYLDRLVGADSPMELAWLEQRVFYRPDLSKEDPYDEAVKLRDRASGYTAEVRSVLDVPFQRGTLAVNSIRPKAFSAEDIEMLQETAEILSEGFARMEDLQTLERRAQEAESLASAIAVVARTHDLDAVFQKVVYEVTRLMSVERSTLFLYDDEEGVLVPQAQVGHDWQIYRTVRLLPGEDLSGQVFETGKPFLIVSKDTTIPPQRPETRALFEKAVVDKEWHGGAAVPLCLHGQVVGTLSAGSARRPLTPHDLDMLERLGDQAVLAIDRARQMEVLEQRNRELESEVSEHRQVEEMLSKLSSAIEQTAELVMITNREGMIEYVNPAFEQLTGYPREEVLGKTPRVLKSGEHSPEFYAELWETILSGQVYHGTLVNRKKNGALYDSETSIAPIQDTQGNITHFVSTDRDITEHRKLEAQLRQAQKMEALGQFTAGIAHNFNNALQVIIGNIQLTKLNVPEPFKSPLKRAENSALTAAEIIGQLMLFSREEPPKQEVIEIQTVLDTAADICRKMFEQRITVTVEVAKKLPVILGDANQLQQVFLNLGLNARDALAGLDRPLPQIAIAVDRLNVDANYLTAYPQIRPGGYIRVQVTDNGSGMDEGTRQRIFEPFFTTKEAGKGTGLGLSTVFALVRDHRGWVECESDLGVGTTFSIYLPIVEPEGTPKRIEITDSAPQGTETILVIDDDPMIRDTVTGLLEENGYRILFGVDGIDGLEVFQRERDTIDLVLLDLSMPRMSGHQVLAELRAMDPHVRVIIMAGYVADKAAYSDAQAILQKPVTMQNLSQTVRTVLEA